MANLDIGSRTRSVPEVRAQVQRSAQLQQARQMLVAACLASACVVLVAGALLAQAL
jgi:hypothetical protein